MRFEAVFATIFSTSLYRFLRSSNRLFHIVSVILISFDSASCVEHLSILNEKQLLALQR